MQRILLVCVFALCVAQVVAADDNNPGAKGPKGGVTPSVNHLNTGNSNSSGGNNGVGQETPFGYEVSQQHLEDQKNGTDKGGGSGGGGGGGGRNGSWVGGTTWHTPVGNGTPAAGIGNSFDGPGQNGWIPYDAAVAVGANYVLVLCNSQFAIYKKSGHSQVGSTQQFADFFNTTGLGTGGVFGSATPFDPKCYYDPNPNGIGDNNGHYVMLVDQQYGGSTANMLIAVSSNEDLSTASWNIYTLDWTLDGATKTSNWGDYPSLGYDDSAIYIGANQYSFSNTYKYSKVRVLSKSQLFSGSAATWTDFTNLLNADGTSAFTVKAGRNITSSSSEYLLNTRPGGGSSVTLWRIDNAPTAPTLTRVATVSVGSYSVPPNARQKGSSVGVATNDCRTQDVVIANENVHTAFTEKYNVSAGSGDGVRYLNVSTGGTLNADVSYFDAGYDRYYPAVTVDNSGNLLMTFSQSDSKSYASMWYTGYTSTDGTPTHFEVAGSVQSGNSSITDKRWGDYSGIANDPSNGSVAWLYGGYAGASGAWATRIVSSGFAAGLPKQTLASKSFNFDFSGNYPNPFATATTLSYTLPSEAAVRLTVVDAMGRTVRVVTNGMQSAGIHSAVFTPGDLPAGVYFCRLESEGNVKVRQIDLLR